MACLTGTPPRGKGGATTGREAAKGLRAFSEGTESSQPPATIAVLDPKTTAAGLTGSEEKLAAWALRTVFRFVNVDARVSVQPSPGGPDCAHRLPGRVSQI